MRRSRSSITLTLERTGNVSDVSERTHASEIIASAINDSARGCSGPGEMASSDEISMGAASHKEMLGEDEIKRG